MSHDDMHAPDDRPFEMDDPVLGRVIEELRSEWPEPTAEGPMRVMAAVRREADRARASRRRATLVAALWRRFSGYLSGRSVATGGPAWGAVAAAVVVIVAGLWIGWAAMGGPVSPDGGTGQVVRLVLAEPGATEVTVAGDFSDWNPLPLHRSGVGSEWMIELRLPPGRHTYAFQVDGQRWVADEAAPTAGENEFGIPISVLLLPEVAA